MRQKKNKYGTKAHKYSPKIKTKPSTERKLLQRAHHAEKKRSFLFHSFRACQIKFYGKCQKAFHHSKPMKDVKESSYSFLPSKQ